MAPRPEHLAYVQAGYFTLTGVWPIVHLRSFMAVTGPKTDTWLVYGVGGLVTAIGASLAVAAVQRTIDAQTAILAILAAIALATIDVVFVLARRISRIYLADAVIECLLVAAWCVVLVGDPAGHPGPGPT